MKIGFLGAGKMAQALAKGFIQAGVTEGTNIIASCAPYDIQSAQAFKNLGSKVTFNNMDVAKVSPVMILAVKPDVTTNVLNDIQPIVTKDTLLISIAMGITTKRLEKSLPQGTRVVRVMPNIPALVKQGASVFTPGSYATEDDARLTKQLLESVGTCDQVPENLLDVVTALSGSGPAYVYVLIEALADGAVRMGMPRDLAYKLAAQTVSGAGKMVLETKEHPGKLKDDVTSPAGSTAEGLYCLESAKFRGAIMNAIEVAVDKCRGFSSE